MDKSTYNDYELLYLMEEEDEDAQRILYQKYQPLLYEMTKTYYQRFRVEDLEGVSFDEFISIGFKTLEKSIRTYDGSRGAIFYTYFSVCLKRAFQLYRRSLLTLKNQPLFHYDEKDYEVEDVLSLEVKWKDNPLFLCESLETEERIKNFMYDLEGLDRAIFELRLNGFAYTEIATILETTTQRVGKVLQKLRGKLKKQLNKIDF